MSLCLLACAIVGAVQATPTRQGSEAVSHPPVTSPMATVLRRFKAAEANQGVAVDKDHFYAVANIRIGKYEKATGKKVAEFVGTAADGWIHMDSGVIVGDKLICAHSNFPGTPMVSSIETFDAKTLKHIHSRPFGFARGSATWIDRYDNSWWIAYAHYAGNGGEPGKGPERSVLVRYDDKFNEIAVYAYPKGMIERFDGMSNSGGSWGADGLLYATGHHSPEVFVLRLPKMGGTLELVRIYGIESEGQGIAFDRSSGKLWTMQRKTREVFETQVPGN